MQYGGSGAPMREQAGPSMKEKLASFTVCSAKTGRIVAPRTLTALVQTAYLLYADVLVMHITDL
jgi:hypothetical protein